MHWPAACRQATRATGNGGMMTKRDISRFAWWLVALLPLEEVVRLRPRPERPGQILVLRLDALGDFVLWLDAARALRTLYPAGQYEITLLGNQSWAPLAAQTPYFDHVWGMDRIKFATRLGYRFQLLQKIRRAGFATVINTAFSREFLWSDSVVRVSGAQERIGYQGECSIIGPALMRLTDSWYTRLVPARPEPRMELERNADFVRGLGLSEFRAGLPRLPETEALPSGFPVDAYFVLVPGAGRAYRQWPLERFAETAQRLHRERGWIGVVAGGPDDTALGAALEQACAPFVQDWTGKTSLAELNGVLAGAEVVVSNETSAVHIAAALGTPVVSVTGGGHFGRYVPYRTEQNKPEQASPTLLPVIAAHPMPCFGCNWECIYPAAAHQPKPCIAEVSTEMVWAALQLLLGAAGGRDAKSDFRV